MIPKNKQTFLSNCLDKEEIIDFEKALAKDKVISSTLVTILKKRLQEADSRDDLVNDINYAVKRPYLDGRFKELRWLLELLTPEEDSDESSTRTKSVGRQRAGVAR